MPDYLGADQRKTKEDEKDDKPIRALDEGDIALLKTYGQSTYSRQIKQVEDDIQQLLKKINELTGIKESDTGLAPPALWDLAADKQTLQSEQPLQVARCTKIINADSEDPKYIINVKQFAKFVVDLSDQVAPTDIEEGMRVGVDRNKYQIHIPLPPKIDPTVTMMQVEEKPDVTYSDVGGCKEQIEKLREVVETLYSIQRGLLTLESSLRRVCCYLGHQAQARPSVPGQWPIGLMLASSELSGLSLYRSTSVRGLEWFGSFLKWPGQKKPALFSLMKLMPLEGLGLTMALGVTMRCRGPCWSSSISWMALILGATSKCSWPLTDLILWTQR